jgi:cation diffusion facilitator family transporter
MVASLSMTFFKFLVGFLTGSLGIISEAIHSLVDFMAISSEPADHNHHYGHDKVESLAALVETGLLFGTSLWVMYEAAIRIFGTHTGHVEVTWYALLVIILSIAIDFNRSRNLHKVAKETGSQALEADALHFASDMYSSCAVLVGLVLTYTGVTFADSLSACVVSVMIFSAGIELGKKSLAVLMDEAPEGVSQHICKLAKTVSGVAGIHDVNVRSLDGTRIFTDLSIYIDGSKTLREASAIKQDVETLIAKEYEGAHIIVHIDTARV